MGSRNQHVESFEMRKQKGTVIKIRKNISIHDNEGVVGIVMSYHPTTKQYEVYCTNGKSYWLLDCHFEVLCEV